MAFEFLVSSDFHIGSMTNIFNDALKKQITEIHKLYSYAIENGIRYIIIPGDLTDTTVLKNHEVIELIRLFAQYDDSVETHYVMGNHDYHSSHRSSVDVLKHLAEEEMLVNLHIHTEPKCIKLGGININFVPYPHTERPNKKGNCINFVHMDTAGGVDDNGYQPKIKHEFKYSESDITISGHIHKHQELKKGTWIFCGNLYQKKFDETSVKGFMHCTAKMSDGLKFSFKFVPSRPEFTLKTVRLKSVNDIKKLETGPHIAYKLEPDEGVLLPSDIGTTHNVVQIKNKFNAPAATITSTNSNLRSGLKKYLINCGLTDDQVKTAISNVKEAINVHSLEG